MGLMKRAWLYITRKKGRSILLFLVLFVMATFALAGLSVRAGAEEAAQKVRESLGSSFELEVYVDYNDESLWTVMPVEGTTDAVSIYASPEYVTDSLIEKIARVEGIKAYNAETRLVTYTGDLENRPGLEYYMSRDTGWPPEEREEMEAWSKAAPLFGEDSSELSDFFRIGAFEIAEGRHITPEDSDKVLISEDIAKRNGLAVGDRIRLEVRRFLFEFGVGLDEVLSDPFMPEIAGIYKINFAQVPSEDTPGSMIPENYIFCDNQMAQRMWGYVDPNFTYDAATFFVEDPKNMESVIGRVKSIEGVDWNYLEITQDDTAYQAEIGPLRAIGSFATVLVVLLLAGCAVVMFLILMMWTRSRRREMGILRAAGIKRSVIIRQFLAECLLVAAAALAVSFFFAGIVAGPLGAAAAEMATSNAAGQEFKTRVNFDEGITTIERSAAGLPPIFGPV
jgi:ABC-type lipoprotein release transport system permease subunit